MRTKQDFYKVRNFAENLDRTHPWDVPLYFIDSYSWSKRNQRLDEKLLAEFVIIADSKGITVNRFAGVV